MDRKMMNLDNMLVTRTRLGYVRKPSCFLKFLDNTRLVQPYSSINLNQPDQCKRLGTNRRQCPSAPCPRPRQPRRCKLLHIPQLSVNNPQLEHTRRASQPAVPR